MKRNIAKKKEDEEGSKCYTTLRAFNLVLREWDALAGQHEVRGRERRVESKREKIERETGQEKGGKDKEKPEREREKAS